MKMTGKSASMATSGSCCQKVGPPTTTGGDCRLGGKATRWASRVRVRARVKSRFQASSSGEEMRFSQLGQASESATQPSESRLTRATMKT